MIRFVVKTLAGTCLVLWAIIATLSMGAVPEMQAMSAAGVLFVWGFTVFGPPLAIAALFAGMRRIFSSRETITHRRRPASAA